MTYSHRLWVDFMLELLQKLQTRLTYVFRDYIIERVASPRRMGYILRPIKALRISFNHSQFAPTTSEIATHPRNKILEFFIDTAYT